MLFTKREHVEREVIWVIDATVVGERLRKYRGEIPMQIVADDNGISLSALGMYETGKRIPRDEIKIKLAKYYGTTIEALFFAP